MKTPLTFFLIGFLLLNSLANAQSIETKFQNVLDSTYTANPNITSNIQSFKYSFNQLRVKL